MELTGKAENARPAEHRRNRGLNGVLASKAPAIQGLTENQECSQPNGLAANPQPLQNGLITLGVRISQVSQKPPTLGDQGEQTFA